MSIVALSETSAVEHRSGLQSVHGEAAHDPFSKSMSFVTVPCTQSLSGMNISQHKHRMLFLVLIAIAVAVVIMDFFIFEMAQSAVITVSLTSLALSFLSVLLSLYAIGFTTLRHALLSLTVVAVIFSVMIRGAASQARFAVSKRQFEVTALSLSKGSEVNTPRWIGTFHVKKISRNRSGQICFWTVEHPYGNTGIVYCPDAKKPSVNRMVSRKLKGDWHYVCVD